MSGAEIVPLHALVDDDLCNFSCTCGGWRYAHVGSGEPVEVAQVRFEVHEEITSYDSGARDSLINRIVGAADYPGMFAELLGYVSGVIEEGGTSIEPRGLHEYLRDLKHRYVADPVRAALRESRTEGR